MPAPHALTTAVWLFDVLILSVAVLVYGRIIRHLASVGGRVRSEGIARPEALMGLVLGGYFALQSVSGLLRQPEKVSKVDVDLVLPGSLLLVLIVVGIGGFLRMRGLRLRDLFGFDRVKPLPVIGWASGLLLTAMPLLLMVGAITVKYLQDQAQEQPLVELFRDSSTTGDYSGMVKIFVGAVIFAPLTEEFLFRGFFYGIGKRYLGPLGAGFIVSLLFAASHANVASLPTLFVLAICLTLAYERTGSLFVPMTMHALFNCANLVVLYAQAHQLLPAAP